MYFFFKPLTLRPKFIVDRLFSRSGPHKFLPHVRWQRGKRLAGQVRQNVRHKGGTVSYEWNFSLRFWGTFFYRFKSVYLKAFLAILVCLSTYLPPISSNYKNIWHFRYTFWEILKSLIANLYCFEYPDWKLTNRTWLRTIFMILWFYLVLYMLHFEERLTVQNNHLFLWTEKNIILTKNIESIQWNMRWSMTNRWILEF